MPETAKECGIIGHGHTNLLDGHEGISVQGFHVEADVDLDILQRYFVQEHTAMQLVDDARVISHNAPNVLQQSDQAPVMPGRGVYRQYHQT
jgi:hypothetical protein